MRRFFRFYTLSIILIITLSLSCTGKRDKAFQAHSMDVSNKNDFVFQVSTIGAILKGVYDGQTTFGQLKRHGGFGIGTFNGLDGEMIAVDGVFYQVKSDGRVNVADDKQETPYAVITNHESDIIVSLLKPMDFDALIDYIDSLLPNNNTIYAIKIYGTFSYVKTRSVPLQKKPYPPLAEVIKNQPTFELENIEGSMVGFKFPNYFNGLNMPGYHFHFISKGRHSGGHVLKCMTQKITIGIDVSPEFHIKLPEGGEFYDLDFDDSKKQTKSGNIEKVFNKKDISPD